MAVTQESLVELSDFEVATRLRKAKQEFEAAQKAKENLAGRNEFMRGVVRGTDQLQATYQGGMGMVNALVGNDAEAANRFSNYQDEMRQSTENPATVDKFFSADPKSGAMASAGNMATWAAGTAGSLIPSVAESVVSGVAGGVAGGMLVPGPDPGDVATVPVGALAGMFGKGVVKKAIAEAAEQYVKQGVKKEAAEQMATQAVRNVIAKRTGATVAAQQTTALNEGGGMYMEGREKGYDNPVSAMALGQVSGASEVAFGVFPKALGMAFKKAGVEEIAKQSGWKAAAGYMWGIAEESGQEGFQQFLGSVNKNINDPKEKIFTKENFAEWMEASAAGALGGGMFGAGGAAVSAYQNRGQQQQTPLDPIRDSLSQNTPTQLPPTQPAEAPTYNDVQDETPDPVMEGLSPEAIQRLGELEEPPKAHKYADVVHGDRRRFKEAPKPEVIIQQWENARAAVTGVGTQYAQEQGVPDDADALAAQEVARRRAAKAGTQPPIDTEAPPATPTEPQATPTVQGVDWKAIATAGTELLPTKAKEKGLSDEELAKTKSEIESLVEPATQGDVDAQKGLIAIAKELEAEKSVAPKQLTAGEAVSGAGKGIVDGLYDKVWNDAQSGSLEKMDKPPLFEQLVLKGHKAGFVKSVEDVKSISEGFTGDFESDKKIGIDNLNKLVTKYQADPISESLSQNTLPQLPTTEKVPPVEPPKKPIRKDAALPQAPRAMEPTEEGRPVDGKPVMPGDKFLTNTGRETTPYPKYDGSSDRKAISGEKKSQQWLIENALAEAESRGDEFNARTFRNELEDAKKGRLPQASKDSATLYVFGESIPKVPKSILKDVSQQPKTKIRDSLSQNPKPEQTKGGDPDEVQTKDGRQGKTNAEAKTKAQGQVVKGDQAAVETPSSGSSVDASKPSSNQQEFDDVADKALEAILAAEQPKTQPTKKTGPKEPKADTPIKPRTLKKPSKSEETLADAKTDREAAKAAAAALMAKHRSKLTSGVDPELMAETVQVALMYVRAGAKTFKGYVEAILEDFGDAFAREFAPYMESGWRALRKHPDKLVNDDAGKVTDYLEQNAKSDYGTVEKPNRVELGKHFAKRLSDGASYPRITDARKEAAELIGGMPKDGTSAIKDIDEAVEIGVVRAARDIAQSEQADEAIYDQLVDLYKRQPNLGTRTSTSMKEQAYSTPAPLAFVVNRRAGITPADTVYDSSAGNGMLLIVGSERYANELNLERAESLRGQGIETTNEDATSFSIGKPIDALVINPPFSPVEDENGKLKWWRIDGVRTDKVDHAITLQALKDIPDSGKAAIIIGAKGFEKSEPKNDSQRGSAYLKGKQFYDAVYDNYNVVDHFTVHGDLYSRQGATFPVDVIVVDGKGKSQRPKPYNITGGGIPQVVRTWEELKDGKLRPVDSTSSADTRGSKGTDTGEVESSNASTTSGNAEAVSTKPARGGVGESNGRKPGPKGLGQPNEQPGVANATDAERTVVGKADGDRSEKENRGQRDANKPSGSGRGDRLKPDETAETDYQVSYSPGSRNQSVDTLIPRNHQSAVEKSLDSVAEMYGDIDEFVARELGYTAKEMEEAFSAEQADAIALAIARHKEGGAFILGDQTGVGKGRVVAAMMIYANRKGLVPVFITEKPTLYADMMRDIIDIGRSTEENPFNVLMTNSLSGKNVVPLPDGRELKQSPNAAKSNLNSAVANIQQGGNLSIEKSVGRGKKKTTETVRYDAIFTTYSQLQPVHQFAPERSMLLKTISPKSFYILDESHNAGGGEDSDPTANSDKRNSGQAATITRAEIIRDLIADSAGVYFSSATYAKRPQTMGLYARTGMTAATDNDAAKLSEAIAEGGVPLQQVVSEQLVESGMYLRRERSFDGVSFDPKTVAVDLAKLDKISAIFEAINTMDGYAQSAIEEIADEITSSGGAIRDTEATGQAGVESTSFSSILHNLVDQMLLAVKADSIAEETIASIKSGESPVIYVDSTLEAALKRQVDELGATQGEVIDFSYRDLLRRYLERSREYTMREDVDDAETVVRIRLTDEQLGPAGVAAYERSMSMIDSFSEKIPASPIDWIRKMVSDAGYSIGEITGRQIVLDYGDDGLVRLGKRLDEESGSGGRTATVSRFNDGTLDAVLINQSGSTGISMHASEKFANQKPRHMIIGQPARNIDTFMQALGRVHRTGQVVLPRFTLMMTDAPAEIRPASVLVKKLASLNANVTASAKGSVSFEVPDVINILGDQIVAEYLADNLELDFKLGQLVQIKSNGTPKRNFGIAKKASGRMALRPVAEQKLFWDSVVEAYDELVNELNRIGKNPLVASTLDLQAKTIESTVIFEGDSSSDNAFSQPASVEMVRANKPGTPMTTEEITDAVTKFYGKPFSKTVVSEWLTSTISDAKDAFEDYVTAQTKGMSEEEAKIAKAGFFVTGNQQLKNLRTRLTAHTPGTSVSVYDRNADGSLQDIAPGFVIRAKRSKGGNPLTASKWTIDVAIASPDRIAKTTLSRTGDQSEDASSNYREFLTNMELMNETSLREFSETDSSPTEMRYVGVGNILAAYSQLGKSGGKVTFFTDSSGAVRRGVLMPRSFKIDKWQEARPVVLDTVAQAREFMSSGGYLVTPDKALNLMMVGNQLAIRAPKAKSRGGKYTLNPAILKASAPMEFVSIGGRMEMIITDSSKQDAVLEAIMSIASLQANNESKKLARRIKEDGNAEAKQDLAKKITDIPETLYQTDKPDDVNPSTQVQAFDIALAAEDAGIKTFDQLVAYSVKTVGERRTREIGGFLRVAAKAAGFEGIRPIGDVLGVPGVTKEQAAIVAKAAFGKLLSEDQIEAGIDIVDRLGLLDKIGFAPFGSQVPEKSLNQKALQTDTPEFKKWFGDSKVVNKDGNPLRLVHGTNAKSEFTEFSGIAFAAFGSKDTELTAEYSRETEESRSFPVYFKAEKPAYLELELNDTIVPEDYEQPEKPWDWDEEEDGEWESPVGEPEGVVTKDELAEHFGMSTDDFSNLYKSALEENKGWYGYPQVWRVVNSNAFKNFLKESGYDSFNATEGGSDVWAVISPTQVKSAIGNQGAFDPNNPNILMQNQTQGGNVKGWTSFISATRAIIGATDKADVSTFIHEIAHPMRRFLLNRDVPQSKRANITDDEISMLEKEVGVKDGVWEVENEERFAKMWERYWFEGKPPKNSMPELESLFEKIAQWMQGIYKAVQQIIGKPLPQEVRDLFDKLVQRGEFRDSLSQNENRDSLSQKGDPEITSIKNAIVNELRARRGVPGLEDSASQSQEEWLEAAHDILQNDPNYGDRLVKELNKKARNLESVEIAAMQIYYGMINNRLTKASARLDAAKASGDPVESANALMDNDIIMNTLWEMETANKAAGSEWSRSGTARQIELDEDFSLVGVMRKARIANAGNVLSDKQQDEMRELARENADLQGKLAKEIQKNNDLRRRKNVEDQIEDSKGKVQPIPESIRKKVSDKVNAFKSKFASAFASSKKTENLFATEDEDMADEAKSVIQEYVDTMGVSSLGELLSNLRKDLGSDIPVSVQAAFTTAWKDMKDNGDIPVPMVDKNNVRGLSRLAKQIERSLVEAGITDLDEVVRGVHESLQEIIPDITPREAMDAISGYGQYSSPSENPDDKIIADINGRLLELAKLDDMEAGVAPARTGVGRQEKSPEHRELIRKVNLAKREGNYRVTDPDTQLKTAVGSALTALTNRIHDLNKAIRQQTPIISGAKTDLAGQDDRVVAMRKERDELTAAYKTLFPKPGATMEQRIAATARALDRVAESLEKQMETKNFETKKKLEPISTDELDAKRARIDALRAQREGIAEYKEWTDEQKSKAYKANLLKQIADYKDRALHSYFGPKPKKEVRKLSPEEITLGLELQNIRDEFFRLAGLYRLQNMSPRERAWDYAKETAHLSRALMTSADFSAVFRQGGAIAFAHPKMAAETSAEMYRAMRSEAAAFELAGNVRNDEMYQFAMTAGLSITEDEGKITKQEEAYMGRWARLGIGAPGTKLAVGSKALLSPIAASARGYMAFLNGIRFKLFKHMVATLGKGGQVTADEAAVIAMYINAATGRSELGPMMKWAEQANMLFFAPRFVASRFQYLGMPLWLLGSKKVSGRVKKAIAMEYIRHSAGVGSFLALTVALGALLGGDDEDEKPTVNLDPRSSDFLKIKLGETRIDPMSGLSQIIVLVERIRSGQRVGEDGEVIDMRGEDMPYGGLGVAGTVGNFVRTKFAPIPGAAFDIANGKNVVGQDVTPFSSIVNLFIPLSLREIRDTAESRGIPQGALIALMSLHGMGSSTYGPESNYRKGTPEIREKQFKKDIRKMTFDSKDPKYKGLLSKEQMTQVAERREDRKQGLVFSAAANPIRKDFKNDETYGQAVKERDTALENLKKSGLTLDESRKLLIDHWESSYGGAKEMRKGVRVYKEALSDRLKRLRKVFEQ